MTILLVTANESDILKAGICAAHRKIRITNTKNLDECHSMLIQKTFGIVIFDRFICGRGAFSLHNHTADFGLTALILVYNELDEENLAEQWLAQNQHSRYKTEILAFATALSKQSAITTNTEILPKSLRPQAKQLLKLFVKNAGKPVSIEHIAEKLWGCKNNERKNTIYTYICELRKIFTKNGIQHNPITLCKGAYIFKKENLFE